VSSKEGRRSPHLWVVLRSHLGQVLIIRIVDAVAVVEREVVDDREQRLREAERVGEAVEGREEDQDVGSELVVFVAGVGQVVPEEVHERRPVLPSQEREERQGVVGPGQALNWFAQAPVLGEDVERAVDILFVVVNRRAEEEFLDESPALVDQITERMAFAS